jgi:hypothetical protein
MKKLLTLFSLILASTVVFGQTVMPVATDLEHTDEVMPMPYSKTREFKQGVKNKANIAHNAKVAAAGDTIVYESFGGGSLPAGWSAINVTGPGNWAWTNQMSQGQYAAGTQAINSPTGTNGFMILDADAANSPTPSGGFLDVDAILAMPAQNLTSYPAVVLEFTSYFRPFSNSTLEVEVIAGGDTAVYDVRHGVATNSSSANALTERIKISSVAGGQNNVIIRFHWSGESHYFWQVDDVLLLEGEDNDLAIGMDPIYTLGTTDTNSWPYYWHVPARQANNQDLTLGGDIYNVGNAAQTNVQLHAESNGPNGFSWSGTSFATTIASATLEKKDITSLYNPNGGVGAYDVTMFVTSDSVLADVDDDTVSFAFEVSDSTFAKDRGTGADVFTDGWSYNPGAVSNYELGNLFEIKTADTIVGVEFFVSDFVSPSTSVFSMNISFHVWQENSNGGFTRIYSSVNPTPPDVSNPDRFVINSNDIGNWVFYPFDEDTLNPGNYWVTFEANHTAGIDTMVHSYSGDYTIFTQSFGRSPAINSGNLFGLSRMPMVRLITKKFSCPVFNYTSQEVTQASCGASDGAATVDGINGVAPYSFQWDSNAGNSTDSIATNLAAGTYQVTITDANNCSFVAQVNLSNIGAPSITSSTIVDEDCFGDEDGSIDITVSGGTAPLTYTWKDGLGATVATGVTTLTNLKAGTYTVEILDASATPCLQSRQFVVAGPSLGLTLVSTIIGPNNSSPNLNCAGDSDGSINIGFAGGTTPYSYSWSDDPGANTNSRSNLTEGGYTVTITDANNCTFTSNVNITEPQALNINPTTAPPDKGISFNPSPSCQASITPLVTGGTTPRTYQWTFPDGSVQSGLPNATLSNVDSEGNYTLLITDDNSCTLSGTWTISNSLAPGVGCVSVEEIAGNNAKLNLFPNPTQNGVSVHFNETSNDGARIEVKNMIGQIVYAVELNGESAIYVNMEEFEKGVYLVSFLDGTSEETHKVILR